MDYILFGIQGSGKGTQGKIIQPQIGAAYFETGGALRTLAQEDSELGKRVKSIIEAGNLVDDELVMQIVADFLQKLTDEKKPVIYDGIPRKKQQGQLLEDLLKKKNRKYMGIYFELAKEQAEKRLLTRRICKNCKEVYPATYTNPICEKCNGELVTRADDNADSIKRRIEAFFTETLPVIEDWQNRGLIIKVDASKSIPEVTNQLNALIPLKN